MDGFVPSTALAVVESQILMKPLKQALDTITHEEKADKNKAKHLLNAVTLTLTHRKKCPECKEQDYLLGNECPCGETKLQALDEVVMVLHAMSGDMTSFQSVEFTSEMFSRMEVHRTVQRNVSWQLLYDMADFVQKQHKGNTVRLEIHHDTLKVNWNADDSDDTDAGTYNVPLMIETENDEIQHIPLHKMIPVQLNAQDFLERIPNRTGTVISFSIANGLFKIHGKTEHSAEYTTHIALPPDTIGALQAINLSAWKPAMHIKYTAHLRKAALQSSNLIFYIQQDPIFVFQFKVPGMDAMKPGRILTYVNAAVQ